MNWLASLVFLFFAACSSPVSQEGKTLRISFNTMPSTLDPRKSGDFISSTLICMLYEGLTRCLPDGSPELALAESVDVSEDGKIYLFHLRKAFWSDGKPIRASEFETSWKSILDPAFPSVCAYLLFPIKNGEKCAKGLLSPSEAGIQALDDSTLRVELERPAPYFLSLTSFPLFLPIPDHCLPSEKEIVSCGPFLLEKWTPHSEIVLKKNPLYWNGQGIDPDSIHIAIVPDETTALQLFEQGQLDWMGGPFAPLPLDALERLSNVEAISSDASTFCTFNTAVFPFQNEHLRKAFSLSIDREELQNILPAGQQAAARCLPPSLFEGKEKKQFQNDRKKARFHFERALEELQISRADLESLTLYYKPGQIESRLAQALQKQWKEELGVSIQLSQIDFKSHIQLLQKKNFQIALANWIAQFHDPVNLLDRFKDPEN